MPHLPQDILQLVRGYAAHAVATGCSGAVVYRLEDPGRPPLYLKHGRDAGGEHERLLWLEGRVAVPRVVAFTAAPDGGWLLTSALAGVPAYTACVEHGAAAIVRSIVAFVRALHATPAYQCPFDARLHRRLAAARTQIAEGLVDNEDFGSEHAGWTAEQVWTKLESLVPAREELVFTHGDFTLDNVLVDHDGNVTGCVDWGGAGVADRYQDLALMARDLEEFGVEYARAFLEGCGPVNEQKLRFYRALDEFF